MRRLFTFILCAAAAAAWAAAPVSDGGWNPNKNKRKKRNPDFVGNRIMPRGPQYSQPDAPPPAEHIPNLIQASNPTSPNSVAAQSLGMGGGDCSSIESQAQAMKAQIDALNAKLAGLLAKQRAALASQIACGANPSCAIFYANQGLGYAQQAGVEAAKVLPLVGQMQALQGKAASCKASGGGAGGAQALPPGVTLQNVANRFGAAGNMGGGAGRAQAGPGLALQQLQELADQGEDADWDGRGTGRKVNQALSKYGSASKRASYVGRRVQAGKVVARNPDLRYSSAGERAQGEYLKINYKELGPKYEALAQERREAANGVADQVLGGLSPAVPAPDLQGGTEIKINESQAINLGGAGAGVMDELKDEAKSRLEDEAKEAFFGALPQGAALQRIVEIDQSVMAAWDLRDDLMAALNEIGSGSLSTVKTDELMAKLGGYWDNVRDTTFSQDTADALAGGD